jgi:hypothetical protein
MRSSANVEGSAGAATNLFPAETLQPGDRGGLSQTWLAGWEIIQLLMLLPGATHSGLSTMVKRLLQGLFNRSGYHVIRLSQVECMKASR